MFPTFIGILDIQSWWEVPSIAHFCSLFRAAFNLLDFDIEDLEEALLTDGGTEGRLLQELIVKLLEGCLPNDTRNDISTFNYQMFLRRLFRKKCQEYKCENPFNTDVDFELLPLRQKVEILRALCDFRLDAEDVEQSLSNLDSDSLRVEPLGHDRKNSAYWYFYGTRLYREDYIDTSNSASHKQKSKPRDKKRKKRRNRVAQEEQEEEEKEEASLINNGRESVWQVVCFTQQDWSRLVEKFRDSEYETERKLYRTLSEDFMPEIPKLFDLKEKQQRRKLLQRNSSRVLRSQEPATQMDAVMVRSKIKTKTTKGTKKGTQASKSYIKEETTPPSSTPPVQKKGRQTNNSLASAVGQIVIHTRDEVEDLEKKKGIGNHGDGNYVSCNYGYKYGYSFGIEEEERCVGMHKVLESVKDHVDAWPFIEPVDEDYAPRYYSVVRRPMDLKTMEEKLENGSYKSLSQFKRDFRLIVDNCRQYNGSDNEYTDMAINLKEAFDKAVSRYLESETSSDEDTTSPRSLAASPTSLPYPSRHLSSSHQNARKRSKKSTKKSKSYKPESKTKSKSNEKVDEDEKRNKSIKVAKKKRGKKKGKKVKEEESDEDEEEQEDQESEDAISEVSANIVTSKRRKNVDVNSLLKTKKLSKETEELKTNKKASKERHRSKKDTEIVRSAKETKENKKRKEDFEEDYEPPVIAKSKSRKIEKKELEETAILTDNAKKSKLKKIEVEESDTVFEESKKQSSHVKTKKNRKKEKSNLKTVTKSDEKSDKGHIKQKNKKSKQKNEELKNGELKSQTNPKDVELESALDSKHTHISKKLSTLIGNKDVDSLDSLKDKISDRRREEKLKNEKEKQKKTVKGDVHGIYSKKVPSNSSTFHDNGNAKRSKSKKSTKEDKIVDDAIKKCDPEVSENKKITHAKHTKGLGAEESATIQALNQATEKTLHDINKWLDDAPRLSGFSSGSDSPVLHTFSIESNRPGSKVETARKRPSSIKIFGPHGPSRPKKIQRTIDRLQPGKSKGNLLLKKPLNVPSANANDAASSTSDNDQSNKDNDEEPKLSLGTVLKNVDSIQLICKSLVSSPNPNLSNDDEEEDHSLTQASNIKEEKTGAKEATKTSSATEEKEAARSGTEEAQKPKSATPNLSAWFKAFGAPKSKKKDEEAEEVIKKDGDSQEAFCGRQRRLSTGGSSVSESVSSFSQESPPAPRVAHSPQCQPVITPTEPIRGAGFYQDALSTGSSPYNSPYYATPPRYSAQLPPTPSPQNHPLSPAYPSPYEQPPPVYPQVHAQPPYQSPYQKSSPQDNTNETYPQMSPQRFSQQLPANNQNQSPVYPQHSPQPMQPVYPQSSPQTPPSNYSQPSPQQPSTPSYSQPSPQQNAVANYSQPSPQAVANYPQASPQQQHSPYSQSSPQTPPNYSQPSPQQQHSPYAQTSPQQPAGYVRLSPQPPPANYSQPSPQPPNAYAQPSSQPPNFSPQSSPQARPANYSQSSPQPPNSYPTSQHDRNYSQSSHQQIQTFAQHSPQTSSPFSESSPQSLTNYPQSSPQQPATYSHPLHSPQTPPNYSQLSPQQTSGTAAATAAVNYSQPSPQQLRNYPQTSPQQKPTCNPAQPPQQSPGYSQPSPQQSANYSQLQSSKNSEEYAAQAATPSANYPQDFKQNPSFIQHSPTISSSVSETEHRAEYLKSNATEKPAASDQQRNFPVQSESLNLNANHQIYQSSSQYPPTYPNNFPNVELQRSASRHGGQQQTQQQQQSAAPQDSRTGFTEIQPRGFLGKASSGSSDQLSAPAPPDQTQLLAFQQNLTTAHESLYPGGFQPSAYPLPPPNSRPVYPSPHYFDAGSKSGGGGGSGAASGSPSSNPPPMKKRAYEPPASESGTRGLPQESVVTRPSQEQSFSSFEPMMALPQSEAVSVSQFDGTPFVSGLADSMATNSAYARLTLGLVGRAPSKDQQQLLTIPRPPPGTKTEHLAAYGRGTAPGPAELEQLNLLQSLQSAAAKNSQGILTISRRSGESDVRATPVAAMTPTVTPSKTKRSRKSKHPQQQEQPSAAVTVTAVTTTNAVAAAAAGDQQQAAGMSAFPQYAAASAAATAVESIGALKTATVAVPPPAGSAFNFAASASGATAGHAPPFPYDKDAATAFAILDEFRNPGSYYNMALRQQQQQQQQPQPPMVPPTVSNASGQPTACNKLGNQPPPRNYPPHHSFLHSAAAAAAAQRSAYVPPVSAYVTPHGPNLTMDQQAAYQQYIHSLYALQPPPHHHRPSWL